MSVEELVNELREIEDKLRSAMDLLYSLRMDSKYEKMFKMLLDEKSYEWFMSMCWKAEMAVYSVKWVIANERARLEKGVIG